MEGDRKIVVSGIEDNAERSGIEGMRSVSEIKSNGDAMTQTMDSMTEIINSGDAVTQTIDSVNGNKVRETKSDKMNINIEVTEEGTGKRVANMEGIVRDGMKEKDGIVARVKSVKGMNELGVIEKQDGMKDKKVENSNDIAVVGNKIGLEKEGAVKLVTPETVAEEKTPIELKVEAINTDTDIKHVDLEQAGIERLAKMERLAENERQAKIKRREELDRVARLQRILALVRAPELDSVAKMKRVNLDEKVIKRDEDINVLKVLGVNTDINPIIDHLSINDKQLTKVETVVDELLTNKKQIDYEGIAKLERMTKKERILEIDRLLNLELEAEAKRKAAIEHAVKLEREAELERETKMKYIKELDLQAELEKAEEERVTEIKRQEKMKRKEESDRIAKLQRVLVMLLASETDRVAEMKQAELEHIAEMKRKEEVKLMEELGILPSHEGTEKDNARKLTLGEKANLNPEVDINLVKQVKPNTDVKEKVVVPVEGTITISEIKQVDALAIVETMANAEQPTQKESETVNEITENTQKEANKNQEAESQTNINYEAGKKRREELKHVAKSQCIIATVRNAEPNGDVTQLKLDIEVDKTADLKRTEEMQLLEELGIVPKKHVTQKDSGIDGPVEKLKVQQMNPVTDVKQVAEVKADVKISTEPNAEQLPKVSQLSEIKMEKEEEALREAKIKRAAIMERKAKADREARIKRREELDRMAHLQRVVALLSNEEFDHIADMKQSELKQIKKKKREEDLKVLESLGILSRKDATQAESETDLKTADKKVNLTKMENTAVMKFKIDKGDIDLKPANAKKPEHIVHMETMTEKERMTVRQDVETRIAELRVAQMKRVAELGREMKQVTMIDEDLKSKQEKFKQTINSEPQNKDVTQESTQMIKTEKVKVVEPIKEVKRKEKLNLLAGFATPDVKQERVQSEGLKSDKGLKSTAVPSLLKVKPEPEMKLVELKRSSEMKVGGMERVRLRECDWDGQMMYVGRESL